MTIIAPPKTIEALPQTVEVVDIWQDDGTAYAGYPYIWRVELVITPQFHSDPDTYYVYDGNAVVVGDWFSNRLGGLAWRINAIESNDGTIVRCIVEDVDQFNTYADTNQRGDGSPFEQQAGFVFSLDALNQPITTPVPDQVPYQWQSDLISRFWYAPLGSTGGGGGGPPPAINTPLPDEGMGAVGTSTTYARGDHVHPLAMTIDGGMF